MRDEGFTLIELMIVVVIIGILAALAIPNYAVFKAQAYNTTAAADARNLAPAADFQYSQGATLNITLDGSGGPLALQGLPGGNYSPGTVGSVQVDPVGYTIVTGQTRGDICYMVTDGAMSPVTCP